MNLSPSTGHKETRQYCVSQNLIHKWLINSISYIVYGEQLLHNIVNISITYVTLESKGNWQISWIMTTDKVKEEIRKVKRVKESKTAVKTNKILHPLKAVPSQYRTFLDCCKTPKIFVNDTINPFGALMF